jgi:APA family basic amino acid/polyamine antiporter
VLRWKRPDLKRPYKLWGYPVVPVVFILAHLWIVWGSLSHKPLETVWGLFIVGLGIPAYFYWRSSKKA